MSVINRSMLRYRRWSKTILPPSPIRISSLIPVVIPGVFAIATSDRHPPPSCLFRRRLAYNRHRRRRKEVIPVPGTTVVMIRSNVRISASRNWPRWKQRRVLPDHFVPVPDTPRNELSYFQPSSPNMMSLLVPPTTRSSPIPPKRISGSVWPSTCRHFRVSEHDRRRRARPSSRRCPCCRGYSRCRHRLRSRRHLHSPRSCPPGRRRRWCPCRRRASP